MRGIQSAIQIYTIWLQFHAIFLSLGDNCFGVKLSEVTTLKQIFEFHLICLPSNFVYANELELHNLQRTTG